MVKVVISQPMYLPWVGFFSQFSLADVFIWLDDAQFSKGSFTNRVQVKMQGGVKWMSIPLAGKGTYQEIRQLSAQNRDWPDKHRSMLLQSFKGQPELKRALEIFDSLPFADELVDTLIASVEKPAEQLDILPKTLLKSSQMNVEGHSWERVLKLVQAVGGTEYITGHGAARYMDHNAFEKAGVDVSYMDYDPRPWDQKHGEFTPYVNILDLFSSVPVGEVKDYFQPSTLPWQEFMKQRETQL